ncbi:MAG: 4-hydroxythreonine-4-phosphate dehydrogenase PdxA [Thermoplasmatales archaeon]|nr:4-hydroxythreonine-4-phosphate dehydrogenase PdxA [Thermoplasmatales archaeon]
MNKVPKIGIIMGDAAGIGPEIIIKTLTDPKLHMSYEPIVIGSYEIMSLMNDILGNPADLTMVDKISEEKFSLGRIKVLNCEVEKNQNFRWAVPDKINGKNSIAYIKEGLRMVSKGYIDGLVMAPLNKESMHMAGGTHPDESSLMCEITGVPMVKPVVKWNDIFRCTVVGHLPFREIVSNLNNAKIVKTIEYLGKTIEYFISSTPRIGVAALNPHAGEGGEFGDEESTILTPAIEESKKKYNYLISGPYPADTILRRAIKKQLDGIVYLYHDQGNIAMKAVAFGEGVLIYAGLPFCVTNPGHGTAYGRAGKGYADPKNFSKALKVCIEISKKWS